MTFTATPVDGSPTPIPMSSAVPDGTNTPLAIAGGPSYTDTGNTKVPVSIWIKDGNDVTLGTSTDANTIASVMGRLTKIRDLLNATLNVAVTNATALGQTTMSASSPITIASDQSPLVTATATRTSVGGSVTDVSLLAANAARKGAFFFNESTATLYLAYGAAATLTSYTVQLPPGSFFEMPPQPIFTGAVRGIWNVANGNVRITELT